MKGARFRENRLLVEHPAPRDGRERGAIGRRGGTVAARTVTVNLAESPLGWLRSRGHLSRRQFDAGEQLRAEWERAQLGPCVTMKWDAPPTGSTARGAPEAIDHSVAQAAARLRFDAALEAAGSGLKDIAWRVICAGEGMRDAEQALGWPARAGKLVLCLALDRLADHYRIR
jgi:hypothetical protein